MGEELHSSAVTGQAWPALAGEIRRLVPLLRVESLRDLSKRSFGLSALCPRIVCPLRCRTSRPPPLAGPRREVALHQVLWRQERATLQRLTVV